MIRIRFLAPILYLLIAMIAGQVPAPAAAERIRATLESTSFEWGGTADGRGRVTASLGVTCLGCAEDTADALLARADRAMYAAKNAGRNRCVTLPPNDGA